MTIEKKSVSLCVVELTIKAEPAEFQAEYDKVEKEYLKNASIPGFRKGKIPLPLLRSKFAKEIKGDATSAIFRALYPKAIDQEGIEAIAISSVKDIKVESGKEFFCVFDVEIKPEFKLPKYKKVAIKVEDTVVTDESVNERIANLRTTYAKYEDGKAEDVVAEEDFVSISFSATLDDKAKTPLKEVVEEKHIPAVAERDGFWLLVDEKRFIPEVIKALVGMKLGETKEGIKVKFPKENSPESIAGKKALYTVTVKELRKRILPDDESLCKSLKDESFDALTKRVRSEMEQETVNQNKAARQNAAVEALIAKSDFEVPASQVNSEAEKGIRDYIQRARYSGMTEQDFAAHREEIMASVMDHATKQVRLTYILEAIAKEEKIEVSDDDMKERLAPFAAREKEPTTAEAMLETLKANGTLDDVRAQMVGEKVVEFIIENAKK
jgi:trigger factor